MIRTIAVFVLLLNSCNAVLCDEPVASSVVDAATNSGNSTEQNGAVPKDETPKLAPDRYREVDEAATVMIWLVTASGLGGLVMLMFIVVGARRMRRLTRSRSLQTQYDELEYLRVKHRREIEQLANLDSPKREPRS